MSENYVVSINYSKYSTRSKRFRKEVAIDWMGGMTISYMAPDKITRLASRTAMEQYLNTGTTYQQLLLGKSYPGL